MSRKIQTIAITAEGRDQGKVFIITELPADQAERWAIRALLGLQRAGVDIPLDAFSAGAASLAAVGLQSLFSLPWSELEPLLAEMFTCVAYKHGGATSKIPPAPIMDGENSQIEEVATRFVLRIAILELHFGFSIPEETPTSGLQPGEETEPSHSSTFLGSLGGWFRKSLQRL